MTGRLTGCKIGDEFRGRSLHLTLSRVLAFSGGAFDEPNWPLRNLHTIREKALEAGLPDIIISGTQFEGLLLSHLVDLFGPAWHSAGELTAKIVKSAFVNDIVTPVAVVRDTTHGVELDVWCEKQTGDKILVGQARLHRDGQG